MLYLLKNGKINYAIHIKKYFEAVNNHAFKEYLRLGKNHKEDYFKRVRERKHFIRKLQDTYSFQVHMENSPE